MLHTLSFLRMSGCFILASLPHNLSSPPLGLITLFFFTADISIPLFKCPLSPFDVYAALFLTSLPMPRTKCALKIRVEQACIPLAHLYCFLLFTVLIFCPSCLSRLKPLWDFGLTGAEPSSRRLLTVGLQAFLWYMQLVSASVNRFGHELN